MATLTLLMAQVEAHIQEERLRDQQGTEPAAMSSPHLGLEADPDSSGGPSSSTLPRSGKSWI